MFRDSQRDNYWLQRSGKCRCELAEDSEICEGPQQKNDRTSVFERVLCHRDKDVEASAVFERLWDCALTGDTVAFGTTELKMGDLL